VTRTPLVVGLGDELYAVERPWGVMPAGAQLRDISDVAVDAQDRVYVFQRTDPPIVIFDGSGAYVGGWGSGQLADAHGIFITPDNHVLLADRDAHQVLRFDLDGTLDLALGERHRPRLQAPFNHPADATSAPNGDILVADGYANSAVHRFSSDGKLLHSWGYPGTAAGAFSTPHAIRVHPDGRLLVADRENNRIQIFSAGGEYLSEWGDLYHPMDIYIDAAGRTFVTDQIPRLTMFAPDGTLLGRCRPVPYQPHGIFGDSHGDLYIAEPSPMDRITKLVRLPG
jgi:sugar lactone lactonase YvrE